MASQVIFSSRADGECGVGEVLLSWTRTAGSRQWNAKDHRDLGDDYERRIMPSMCQRVHWISLDGNDVERNPPAGDEVVGERTEDDAPGNLSQRRRGHPLVSVSFGFHAAGDGLKRAHRSFLWLRESVAADGAHAPFALCKSSKNWLDCVRATF